MHTIRKYLLPKPQILEFNKKEAGHFNVSHGAIIDAKETNDEERWRSQTEKMLKDRLLIVTNDELISFDDEEELNQLSTIKLKINSDLSITGTRFKGQSYRLEVIDKDLLIVEGSDSAGLHYGILTLLQLINMTIKVDQQSVTEDKSDHPQSTKKYRRKSKKLLKDHEVKVDPTYVLEGLPVGLSIQDYPDFEHRGLMLDVSRNRVPTMTTTYQLIDTLSMLKINQLQLYTEHTFAYEGHEEVWKDFSPFTPEEIRELDAYCKLRFIELVPNQNSFGHLHRWLTHERYRHLAECEEGILHPFSFEKEPFSLCPTQDDTVDFLAGLYDQLLPNFSSKHINVNMDETFDLGRGKSAPECKRLGREKVYLNFLNKVHDLLNKKGYKVQFWADIILNNPSLIGQLPKDVVALVWGYEQDHPFNKHCKPFYENKVDFYVCPGTSSWNSIGGRSSNSMKNMQQAAKAGKKYHAKGYLITDWGDNGHFQQLPVSYLPISMGAAYSWNATTIGEEYSSFFPSIDRFIWQDNAGYMSKLAFDIGEAHKLIEWDVPNSVIFFWPLIFPFAINEYSAIKALLRDKIGSVGEWVMSAWGSTIVRVAQKLFGFSNESVERAMYRLDSIKRQIPYTQMARPDAELIKEQFLFTIDFMKFACTVTLERSKAGLDLSVNAIEEKAKTKLTEDLQQLMDRFQKLWLSSHRPGGLEGSLKYMTKFLETMDK